MRMGLSSANTLRRLLQRAFLSCSERARTIAKRPGHLSEGFHIACLPQTQIRSPVRPRSASHSIRPTWWGAQWLQALTQIDHDNRLPRGRTYANRGAVRDLAVHDCHIRARVQGSRPRPYDIDIGVPATPQPTPHAWRNDWRPIPA